MPSFDAKPHLAFRVGVTGKHDLTPEQIDHLRPRIAQILADIKATVEKELLEAQGAYSEDPPLLRATSSLAEGAGRIFAEEALKLGFYLQCPVVFRKEFKKDFHSPQSRLEFDHLLSKANGVVFEVDGGAACETLDLLLVDHCDLLIAVWDGQPDSGKDRTAHIIEMAHRRRIPVVRFGMGKVPDTPLETKMVTEAVRPPWLALKQPEDPDANGSYVETASGKTPLLGRLWSRFFKVMRFGAKLPKSQRENIPANAFRPHYARMDAIANRLAGLYRGAFLSNYTLGVFAVLFALLGNVDAEHETRAKVWLVLELMAIAIIVVLVVSLRQRRWHFRSVDCRYLAEQFRILCYIYPLGLTAPPFRLPAHQMHSDVQKSWMEWRLRSLLRQRPLPELHLTLTEAGRYYKDVVSSLLQGQMVYHERNQASLEKIEKRLDLFGWISIGIAAAACGLHFFVEHSSLVARWLTLCAAGFPAAAAACHAIGSQGEFRRLAERSEAMHGSLKIIHDRMEELSSIGKLSPATLRKECEDLAALMIEEVVDWQILYRKPVPPA